MKYALLIATCVGALAFPPFSARAQELPEPASLSEVTVSTPRGPVPVFDAAASVDRIEGSEMRQDRLQVNLSESLGAVPGLMVQNRQNYAQDLQLSVRGFGARSTFGVRGVRLYVDGIPATMPDGQGQTSHIDIGSADRIEVLRGPFSALYGNSSGGVMQVFTEEGGEPASASLSTAAASSGTTRTGFKTGGAHRTPQGEWSYLVSGSHFHTDGWREHSAADRDLLNAKFGLRLLNGDKLSLVINHARVKAQDPLGVSLEQAAQAPRAALLATQYDTRKTMDQTQFGVTYEQNLGPGQSLRWMVYGGERGTTQFQSIPPAAQQNQLHAGGVIDLSRRYAGLDVRWNARASLAGRPLEWVAGAAYDWLGENRRGYENYRGAAAEPELGVQGRLRRDEYNRVDNLDPYFQATWHLSDRWRLEAGVRRSQVRFVSADHYVTGANGDDSGRVSYRQWLPAGALRYEFSRDAALYVALGRGFETPTLNELSYRSGDSPGLNFGLQPASSTSMELGAKARVAGGMLTAAVFRIATRDEIVTDTSSGGRSTYRNAGRTRRVGAELSWLHETSGYWRTQLAYTWLDARYRDAFCSPTPCGTGNEVPAGNRIPGIARQSLYAAFSWMPPQGWHAGVEWRALSSVLANDRNSARAPGYLLTALYAGYTRHWAQWEWTAFARVDNLFNRRTIGSVIVNEGNGRYFEPAPGRQWTMGLNAALRF